MAEMSGPNGCQWKAAGRAQRSRAERGRQSGVKKRAPVSATVRVSGGVCAAADDRRATPDKLPFTPLAKTAVTSLARATKTTTITARTTAAYRQVAHAHSLRQPPLLCVRVRVHTFTLELGYTLVPLALGTGRDELSPRPLCQWQPH